MGFRSGKRVELVVPPALPQPTQEYNRRAQDQFNNVLRLYFNRLNNVINALLDLDSGGAVLFYPHGTFYSAQDQVADAVDTSKAVVFEQEFDASTTKGLDINGPTSSLITVQYAGVYNIQTVLQVDSDSSSIKHITMWLSKNGVDVPYSAQAKTLVKQGVDQVAYVYTIELEPNDTLQMMWSVDDLGLTLGASAPSAAHPGIPSATISITHVSNTQLEV